LAGGLLAARGIAARPGAAPLCRSCLAGFRLGTRAPSVRRRVPAVLRYSARAVTHSGDGIALRRRNGYRELLPNPIARQPRPGAFHSDPPYRRRRGATLQAFLPVFPEVSRQGSPEPQRRPPGAVATAADDRRR